MDVEGTALNETEPLLSREIFGNVSDVSKFIFYVLATAAIVSFCIGVYRRSRLWKLGTKQTGQGLHGGFMSRFVSNVLLQRRMLGRPTASLAHRLLFLGLLVLFLGKIGRASCRACVYI